MAGVELDPGPVTPGDDKTIKTQDHSHSDDAHNISSEETAAKRFRQSPLEEMEPLGVTDLEEFAEFITPENQERMAVMLGFDLDKVEMLRCKHRENVTGVSSGTPGESTWEVRKCQAESWVQELSNGI